MANASTACCSHCASLQAVLENREATIENLNRRMYDMMAISSELHTMAIVQRKPFAVTLENNVA